MNTQLLIQSTQKKQLNQDWVPLGSDWMQKKSPMPQEFKSRDSRMMENLQKSKSKTYVILLTI